MSNAGRPGGREGRSPNPLVVLDASALLALLNQEDGANMVASYS